MRGQAQSPGVHTFRISDSGVEVFPRALIRPGEQVQIEIPAEVRMSTGIKELDAMMGGGLPQGYSLLVVGPTGSGKTVLATQFLAEGVRMGQPGVIAAFEKSPNQLLSRALSALIQSGKVCVINTRTLDLAIDEILHELVTTIQRTHAKRVVIDSLSGFELALSAVSREDFREALYRMIAVLTNMGVSVLMTAELEDQYTALRFSSYGNAFLADAVIMQRYVELGGQLNRVLSVIKVRGSAHSKDIRLFDIEDDNILIGKPLTQYQGILSGRPVMLTPD